VETETYKPSASDILDDAIVLILPPSHSDTCPVPTACHGICCYWAMYRQTAWCV